MTKKKVGIVGLWHQGIVAAACLADLGYDVLAADYDSERIAALNEGKAPLFEPGLDELLQKSLTSGRLRFTDQVGEAVKGRTFLMLMYDTPVDENDQSDLTEVFKAVREMAPNMEPGSVMLVTAQVPVGSCDKICEAIQEINPAAVPGMAYSPENLRLGQAIERFVRPPLPVFGADSPETAQQVKDFLSVLDVPDGWMVVELRTAEMCKHALNAFLATCITFGNELGNICDEVGADAQEVARVLRKEDRVGNRAMLFPGLGFSGGTLARDMQTLRNLGDRFELDTRMLDGVWEANNHQNEFVLRKLQQSLGDLEGRTVAVWGLTYKPGTSTLRRSASLEIIREMVGAGLTVRAHDPKAERGDVTAHPDFEFVEDAVEATRGAEALIIITGWPEYKDVDFSLVIDAMAGDVLIDCNNMLDAAQREGDGFRYLDVGRGRRG